MDAENIRQLADKENHYWWHVSRRIILKSFLKQHFSCHSRENGNPEKNKNIYKIKEMDPRVKPEDDRRLKIVDVGCGTGSNIQWLQQFGDTTGLDVSAEAISLTQKNGMMAVQGDAEQLPFTDNSFGLITAFDILEHTSNDIKTLLEWHRVLKPNGRVLITVPAYPWLFGQHDKNLGHYRRYYASTLASLLKKSGFKVIFVSYIFFLTLPIFIISRLKDNLTNNASGYVNIPDWLNKLLIIFTSWEAKPISKGWKLPFGSSIIIYARK